MHKCVCKSMCNYICVHIATITINLCLQPVLRSSNIALLYKRLFYALQYVGTFCGRTRDVIVIGGVKETLYSK